MLLITPHRDHLFDVPSFHGDILYFPHASLFLAALDSHFPAKPWLRDHDGAWIDTGFSFVFSTDDILTVTFINRFLFSTFKVDLYTVPNDLFASTNMPHLSFAFLSYWLRPFGLDREVRRHMLL